MSGNFAEDTAIVGGDGRYRARLSRAWEIWGPNGGYLAAIALRAAGATGAGARPATFACHFLSVAEFDDVELEVVSLRRAKRAESLRVSMTQGGRRILEALVWTVDDNPGLEHEDGEMPAVPSVESLRPIEELTPPGRTTFPFWQNFDRRPIQWFDDEAFVAGAPLFQQWIRFRGRSVYDDPYLDAARLLLLIDTTTWPAAWRRHGDSGFIAPSLDVSVVFHRPAHAYDWLLIDAHAPVAAHGLIGTNGRVWSRDGKLLASGVAQLYCRAVATGR